MSSKKPVSTFRQIVPVKKKVSTANEVISSSKEPRPSF